MQNIIKRIFDLIASSFAIIIFSPVLIIVSLSIKLYDSGPVFYRAPRTGKNNVPFKMFKFRSMVLNADKIGAASTTLSDPRITPIGQFLRKHKLDEIPQLFNVLLGQMSIIGPRPEIKKFTDLFNEQEKMILSVKPGISDYASVKFSDEGKILEGSDDPDKAYFELIRPKKIELQLQYVKEKSLATDLKIIFLTLAAIIKK